jgi:hypothetical protein
VERSVAETDWNAAQQPHEGLRVYDLTAPMPTTGRTGGK